MDKRIRSKYDFPTNWEISETHFIPKKRGLKEKTIRTYASKWGAKYGITLSVFKENKGGFTITRTK